MGRRNSYLTRLINSISFAYISIILLCEHYRKTENIQNLSLTPFGSGVVDAISYRGLRCEIERFPTLEGPFAILVVREPGGGLEDRLKYVVKIIEDVLGIRRLLLVVDTDELPLLKRDLDTRVKILFRFHLEWLYDEYGEDLPKDINEARSKLIYYESMQQAMISHEDAKDERKLIHQHVLQQLTAAIQEKKLVLFLGAGTTKDSGGPNWNELLQKLKLKHMKYDPKVSTNLSSQQRTHIGKLLEYVQKEDPLIEAQKLAYGLGKRFLQTIQDAVYRNVNSPGPLLNSIAKLCKHGRIRAIVNYNWDSLLQEALRRQGLTEDVDFKVVLEDGYDVSKHVIPIYYVHGYLPRSIPKYTQVPIPLVFREVEYHNLYNSPYDWVNHVQIQFFRECTCLFLGLSMTDPNLRRLLRIASRKHSKPVHTVCKKWPEYTSLKDKIDKQLKEFIGSIPRPVRYPNKNAIETVFRVQSMLDEIDLRNLKVNIDWRDSYPSIRQIITDLISAQTSQP